jgi:hypothetical protein
LALTATEQDSGRSHNSDRYLGYFPCHLLWDVKLLSEFFTSHLENPEWITHRAWFYWLGMYLAIPIEDVKVRNV